MTKIETSVSVDDTASLYVGDGSTGFAVCFGMDGDKTIAGQQATVWLHLNRAKAQELHDRLGKALDMDARLTQARAG